MKFLVTLSLILVATASNLRSSKIKVFNAIEPDDPDTEGMGHDMVDKFVNLAATTDTTIPMNPIFIARTGYDPA